MSDDEDDYQFLRIIDALHSINQKVNLIGVVSEVGISKQSKGTDCCCTLKIVDESHPSAGISVNFFAENIEKLPCVESAGDIIQLSRVVIKSHRARTRCEEVHSALERERRDTLEIGLFLTSRHVLHICEVTQGEWMLFVWDGTDAPPLNIHKKLEEEFDKPLTLQLEASPLSRDIICTFPRVGTVLRMTAAQCIEKLGLHLLKAGKWVKFRNINFEVRSGIWCGILLPKSRFSYLPDDDNLVLLSQRTYNERVKHKWGRMPLSSFPWPSYVTDTNHDHEDVPFLTLMDILSSREATGKFRCVVRVVATLPDRPEDFRSSSCGTYRIRLTLEDPTARIHAYLYAEDAEMFFGGYPSVEKLIKMHNTLLGVDEADDKKPRNPPWVQCCIKSFCTDDNDIWVRENESYLHDSSGALLLLLLQMHCVRVLHGLIVNCGTRNKDKVKFDELGMEIMSIALPAALALAADPITSLVDTAFVGHLGSAELAAVGVSISIFNLVAKLFNIPLLNITTSFVAEEQALLAEDDNGSACVDHGNDKFYLLHDFPDGVAGRKKFLPAVSTSLALATAFGIAETMALYFGSGFLLNTMGIHVNSPMRVPAEQFTSLRAFGAPAVVLALAAQGTFRGFKDTKTPLYGIGNASVHCNHLHVFITAAGNFLNAILDLILVFFCGLGVGGAAIATVISEYLIAFILLWKLNKEVVLVIPKIDGEKVARYLKSGMFHLYTSLICESQEIIRPSCTVKEVQRLALSLLTDALALAGQAILASSFSQRNYDEARKVIYRILQIGLAAGVGLAIILLLGFGPLSYLFSTDSEVLKIARSGTLFVAASQPMNAIAFVLDGLYYGLSDFGYASYSMVVIGLVTSAFFLLAVPKFGLAGVWAGLFLFMTLRVVAGIWRIGTKTGPWKLVYSETDQDNR
ncbi:protein DETOXIFICATION 44, chloroplastic isoform X1 [Tanacetum coccineum]